MHSLDAAIMAGRTEQRMRARLHTGLEAVLAAPSTAVATAGTAQSSLPAPLSGALHQLRA